MSIASSSSSPPASSLKSLLQAAVEHHQAGRIDEAEGLYRAVLQIQPTLADANHNMGVLMVHRGRPDAALPFFKSALSASPEQAHHWLGYVETLIQAGQADVARQILDLGRQHGLRGHAADALAEQLALDSRIDMQSNLIQHGHDAEQTALIEQDAMTPAGHEIESILTLYGQGRLDEVEKLAQSLADRFPDHAFGWKVLGGVAVHQKRFEDGLNYVQKSAALAPDDAEVHGNLAYIFRELGRKQEAEASFRRALLLKQDDATLYNDMGVTLLDQGRLADAETSFRRALDIKPDYEDAFGNLLFTLNYDSDRSGGEIFAVYREYDACFGLPLRSEWRQHANSRNPDRRLRVGYVSPDFRNHAVRYFLEPLLANHDRNAVEVVAYAELSKEDVMTARYRGYVDRWVATAGMSDSDLAERVRADGIDILVDLAGHTAKNRLGVFARKPAPVSVTWLGYGYTTGLNAVDYILTDRICAPEGSETLFSETPWRVENPAHVYSPAADCGNASPLPAAARGHVTFGTLTRAVRINHRAIRVWSEILKRVEGSRLVINSENYRESAMQAALSAKFAAHGIDPHRLEIGYNSPPWDVLRGIDISLDCFPHNSGTTLFESLYMGVPYVTLAGRPSVGLLGSSILNGIGRPEWIARTESEYIEKAVAMASDLPRLEQVRDGLRTEMKKSPLMDGRAFARKIEAAYKEMFAVWSSESS